MYNNGLQGSAHPHAPKLKVIEEYWYWVFYHFNVSSTWKTLKPVMGGVKRSALFNKLKKETLTCPNYKQEIQLKNLCFNFSRLLIERHIHKRFSQHCEPQKKNQKPTKQNNIL